MLRPILLALLAFAVAAPALADGRQELHSAFSNNLKLKSYKATMTDLTTNKVMSTVEFQAPDRFRVAAAGQPPSVMIGDTMYLNAGGQMMKIPMPKNTLSQYRNEATLKELAGKMTVESLGPGTVGALPARKYRWKSAGKDASTTTAWVGIGSGHVLQVETAGKMAGKPYSMRVSYSDFNSPKIRIAPPN